jgi:hypothetical protein
MVFKKERSFYSARKSCDFLALAESGFALGKTKGPSQRKTGVRFARTPVSRGLSFKLKAAV